VTFILHVSLALLVMASGGIFALAEAKDGIPAIVIPLAIVSLLLVDIYRVWRLPVWLQSLFGLLAFGLAGFEFWLSDIEAPLLSGGHLLTYLTCNFLMQPKGKRQFWWLVALCLLQVAVASVLTYDSWFGLAMPLLLLLVIWTLSVFQLQQAALIGTGSTDAKESPTPTGEDDLWRARSRAVNTIQLDERQRWVTPRFVLSTLSGTALSLFVAGAFFLLIPRVWPSNHPFISDDGRLIGGAPSRTGYTEEITLGHIGEIQESSRVAMEATLLRQDAAAPGDWESWPLINGGFPRFRGSTQELYSGGRWSRWDGAEGFLWRFRDFPRLAYSGVRQRLRVYHDTSSSGGEAIPVCGLPLTGKDINSPRRLQLDLSNWASLSTGESHGHDYVDYEFEVLPWEPWFPNARGLIAPLSQVLTDASRKYMFVCQYLPRDIADGLESWIVERPELLAETESSYALAKSWERWFIDGTEMTYSLNLSIQDPSIDPLLDFLQNTRRGHCEYFASSLALLLRTRGIPTRVVSGYKGGQIDDDGKLVIRDLHAHLWLEAFLEDAPPDPATGQIGPRWITLDPTPGLRDSLVTSQQRRTESVWARLQNWWLKMWGTSLRMSRGDQKALVYDPLKGSIQEIWERSQTVGGTRGLRRLWQFLTSPRQWISWQGGVAAFLILSSLTGIIYGVSALRRRWRLVAARRREDGVGFVAIPFYQRLEAVLNRYGCLRAPAETPREFVAQAGALLSDRVPETLRPLPAEIAERFYAARYGGAQLSMADIESLEARVDELERELDVEALHRERAP